MSVPQANLSSDPSARRDSSLVLPLRHQGSERQTAPIALFVYNRPEHTRQTIESLRANDLAQQSDLFVFADGAKNESEAAAVGAVRKFIRTIDGFKSLTLIEREQNLGLAASEISGVTQLVDEFGRVVVVEDDLLTASDFLTFMNCALERYRDEAKIFSVSGFNFAVEAPDDYPYDVFCSYRCSSWGWGTWRDRWKKADWSVSDFAEFRSDKVRQRSFNRGGGDLSRMLALQMAGKLDSWAIRWAYAHFSHGAAALLPVVSRVYNIGLDGSGVHCRWALYRQHALPSVCDANYRFLDSVIPLTHFSRQIRRHHHHSVVRRLASYLCNRMGLSYLPVCANKRDSAIRTTAPFVRFPYR